LDGLVFAMVSWDPDSGGPQPAVLMPGNSFTIAGDPFANNIAMWRPQTGRWSAPGTGLRTGLGTGMNT